MEKPTNKIKTHDFMNVESFSQLPFIRTTHDSSAIEEYKERPIRLFGIEFATPQDTHQESKSKVVEHEEDNNNNYVEDDQSINKRCVDNNNNNNSNNSNNRRFECHYCCRNFPTSQALGGHQNAHKRERQHAKRAHLLSTVTATATANATFGYGTRHSFSTSSSSYPWTSSRVFGSHHHHGVGAYNSPSTTSPINGTRLGLWRTYGTSATFNRDRSSNKNQSLRFFSGGDYEFTPSYVVGGGSNTRSMLYESKTNVQDHVSLDLHL